MKTRLLLLLLLAFSFGNAQVTAGLIQQFKFDNSYANVAGTTSFSATSFDLDRGGYPNSAIRMTYALQSQATIPGLPYGNAARTISFWVKSLADAGLNYGPVFSYGTGTTGNAFGGGVSTDRTMMVSHNDNYTLMMGGNPNTLNVWYHFVMTYDGTTAKMYRNGQLMGSMAKSWNTINNSDIFKLGVGTGGQQWFNGLIDDLRVYDRAVTDAEALEIYNEPNSNSIGLIKSFSFNNSAADDTNSVSFTTANASFPITYTAGRNAGAGQAMVTTASALRQCTIPNLPIAKRDRTISFWYKNTTFYPTTSFGSVYYGGAGQYNLFALYTAATTMTFSGATYDQSWTYNINPEQWYHIVLVLDNGDVKVYVNSNLFAATPKPLLNTLLSSFKIGAFAGAIDDLKIYDRALKQADISSLYSSNTLSSSDFVQNNLKVVLYPNPVRDILNIETETEIKLVEIYNLQGQKIKTALSKQVNVSDLSAGIYMIRIEDTNNAIETKRIVKN